MVQLLLGILLRNRNTADLPIITALPPLLPADCSEYTPLGHSMASECFAGKEMKTINKE